MKWKLLRNNWTINYKKIWEDCPIVPVDQEITDDVDVKSWNQNKYSYISKKSRIYYGEHWYCGCDSLDRNKSVLSIYKFEHLYDREVSKLWGKLSYIFSKYKPNGLCNNWTKSKKQQNA